LSAAFISVATIMPQAVGSGKARAGCGNHAAPLQSAHFPQSGMGSLPTLARPVLIRSAKSP
jgi:hypothetical protein